MKYSAFIHKARLQENGLNFFNGIGVAKNQDAVVGLKGEIACGSGHFVIAQYCGNDSGGGNFDLVNGLPGKLAVGGDDNVEQLTG
jgi:hypothetical protein